MSLSGSSQEAMPNEINDVSQPNDQLHDILLNIFRQRVDPLLRLIHWPKFLETCRDYRRKSASQVSTRSTPQYAGGFYPDASFDPSGQLYTQATVMQAQNPGLYTAIPESASSNAAFSALLYSIYYAAIISIIDNPRPPDLGPDINVFNMEAVFRKEVTTRVIRSHEGFAKTASMEMLQAMVLNLVRISINHNSSANLLCSHLRQARSIYSYSGCSLVQQSAWHKLSAFIEMARTLI
jgi:hypothetical protein